MSRGRETSSPVTSHSSCHLLNWLCWFITGCHPPTHILYVFIIICLPIYLPTYLLRQISWFPKPSCSGVSNPWPTGQLWPTDCFCQLSFLGTQPHSFTDIVDGCIHSALSELSSSDRGCMASKARTIFTFWFYTWIYMNIDIPIFKFLAGFISKDGKLSTQDKAIKEEGMVL